MIVEIHGANFVNQGAELMLRTAVRELKARIPELEPAMYVRPDNPGRRKRLALRRMLPCPGRPTRLARPALRVQNFAAHTLGEVRYFGLLSRLGVADVKIASALVDVSGFAFSDQWGASRSKWFADLAEAYNRQGKPVIMLPQALGPFEDPHVRDAFRTIVSNATMVYARDAQSEQHAMSAAGGLGRILRAPDITLFGEVPPRPSTIAVPDEPFACVVPNARVLDRGDRTWASHYLDYLRTAAQMIIDADLHLRVVVHSNEAADTSLAERICETLPAERCALVPAGNALDLKALLGMSRCVVGSRYHSLVSAFAQSVPSVALGWSHKYAGLFADFGVSEMCLDASAAMTDLRAAVERVLEPASAEEIRRTIRTRLSEMAPVNEKMWDDVVRVLRAGAGDGDA